MKTEKLYLELEEIVSRLGYRIRREKGNFRGGNCILEGEKLIMLNKNLPPEVNVATLSKLIQNRDHQQLFIKPAVRKALEEIWQKSASVVEPELEFDQGKGE